MIKVDIYKEEELINKISVSGHSQYADIGEDIVCASISTLIFTLIESMDGVLGLNKDQYSYQIDGEIPFVGLEIKYDKLNEKEKCMAQTLTASFELGVSKTSEAYTDFVSISIREV